MIGEELHVFNVAPWCPIHIPTPKQRPVEVHNDQPSMGEWSSTDGKLLVPSIPPNEYAYERMAPSIVLKTRPV